MGKNCFQITTQLKPFSPYMNSICFISSFFQNKTEGYQEESSLGKTRWQQDLTHWSKVYGTQFFLLIRS